MPPSVQFLPSLVLLCGRGAGGNAGSALFTALAAQGGEHVQILGELRRLRNSRAVLEDTARLFQVTEALEQAMRKAYENNNASAHCLKRDQGARGVVAKAMVAQGAVVATAEGDKDCTSKKGVVRSASAPGNFHGVKSHSYYVSAISEAHPSLPYDAVQSIVASEWYHPGLTARSVWCVEGCGAQFPLANKLDANFEAIRDEISAFWEHPDALVSLAGVGSHTTQFDRLIAGNGTWVDVRLWRGRGFNRQLCERHFRTICSIVEASPEIWTNPWSHVLLSILLTDSWVPLHSGHTNGQLTYHLPVVLPSAGTPELALVERGASLPDDAEHKKMYSHPEEHVVTWKQGSTLVFDDSFTHAVRMRGGSPPVEGELAQSREKKSEGATTLGKLFGKSRVVLLMRGWHPELGPDERAAVRDFVRKGGEEEPEGYDMLPISPGVFQQVSQ